MGESEIEENLGDCEDTNNEENTNNQDFDSENLVIEESAWEVSDFESSDDHFEEDWTKLKINDLFENMKTQKRQWNYCFILLFLLSTSNCL